MQLRRGSNGQARLQAASQPSPPRCPATAPPAPPGRTISGLGRKNGFPAQHTLGKEASRAEAALGARSRPGPSRAVCPGWQRTPCTSRSALTAAKGSAAQGGSSAKGRRVAQQSPARRVGPQGSGKDRETAFLPGVRLAPPLPRHPLLLPAGAGLHGGSGHTGGCPDIPHLVYFSLQDKFVIFLTKKETTRGK